ncbi:hypothetical protein PBRA_000008 [Plasmodiophora brassicae]|nr:hypothetical protein PBRA_000008 [Plasmodiophora brassicae]
MPDRQREHDTSVHHGVCPPSHESGHDLSDTACPVAPYTFGEVPYGSVRFMAKSNIPYVKCYTKGRFEPVPVILQDLGQPETAPILTSFESNYDRGFSFINLPDSVMPTMDAVKTSDTVTPAQLIQLGMAVQNSIQAELKNTLRTDWIAVATQAAPRTSVPKHEADAPPLNLVHMDYRLNATLQSLLTEAPELQDFFQFRLATSPIFKRHDKKYGSGNVERADEILELVQTINVWAPIVDVVRSHPLALMSTGSLVAGQAEKCMIGGCRSVLESQVVCPTEGCSGNNKWYWKKGMKFGQAFVFDSRRTPHSSIPIGSDTRKSVEIRVLIMKPKMGLAKRSSPRQPCWTEPMLRVASLITLIQYYGSAVGASQGIDVDTLKTMFGRASKFLTDLGYPVNCPGTSPLHMI